MIPDTSMPLPVHDDRTVPALPFQLHWDGQILLFHDAEGLDPETSALGDRDVPHGRLALRAAGPLPVVRLMTGSIPSERVFLDWLRGVSARRMPIRVCQSGAEGVPPRWWTLRNARPVVMTFGDDMAAGREIFVEAIGFEHEGVEAS